MNHAHVIARRRRLLKTIGDGVAIIPTAPEVVRNRDAHYPYRFDSYSPCFNWNSCRGRRENRLHRPGRHGPSHGPAFAPRRA